MGVKRREIIYDMLYKSSKPIKGSEFAKTLGVTRQIVVKEVALLRAEGKKIIATPDGYILESSSKNKIVNIIAVNHNGEELKDELETIIKYGGVIEDVIIDHTIYGEIKGVLRIKNLNDISNFLEKIKDSNSTLLSTLTEGVHLHTISTESREDMDNILLELKQKGYLLQ